MATESPALLVNKSFRKRSMEREASETLDGSKPDLMLILIPLALYHAPIVCAIMETAMGDFWKEFRENDPTRKPAPKEYTLPGVVMIVVCLIVAIVKIISL